MLWLGKTVLGTTDTAPDDRAAEPSPFREEVEFILNEAGQYLSKPPTRADVLSVRVGLRPLVRPPQAEDAYTQTKALWREHTRADSGAATTAAIRDGSEGAGFHVQSGAVLKAFVTRPMTDMRTRGAGQNRFDDDTEDRPVRALTRDEAQALRARNPPVSPWRVIAVQAAIGGVVVALAWWMSGSPNVMWSALYGVATAVVPGALMARGMTSRLSRASPGASAVSVMWWSMVKIGASVLMLMLAPKLVQPVSWPALLVALVLCMQVYWVALLWRGR